MKYKISSVTTIHIHRKAEHSLSNESIDVYINGEVWDVAKELVGFMDPDRKAGAVKYLKESQSLTLREAVHTMNAAMETKGIMTSWEKERLAAKFEAQEPIEDSSNLDDPACRGLTDLARELHSDNDAYIYQGR